MRSTRLAQLALIVPLLAAGALAPPTRAAPNPTTRAAKSVGSPSQGRLVGGRSVAASPDLRLVGYYRWGLPQLVGMVERAAGRVAATHPGAVLTVGDLSREGGGDVGGHRSHESGRDVDLGFYLRDANGRPTRAARFATIGPDGRALGMAQVSFDDAANWSLVAALLTDREARVLQIFVADPLRTRLLRAAAGVGAPAHVRARAARVMLQPRHALPHDNHFHVRIGCPRASAQCLDFARPAKVAKARSTARRGHR